MINVKQTILVLDLKEESQNSFIIKEILEDDPAFSVIPICGEHFSSIAFQVVDEFVNKYLILKKIKSNFFSAAKDILSKLPIPKKEKDLSFYNKLPLHKKIKNAILRYNPHLVLCLSANALKAACAYKEHSSGEFKVGALLYSYYPNKSFAVKEADFLIVDNYDIKQQFLSYGLTEEHILIMPIPSSPALKKLPSREEALKYFEIDDKPTLFMHTSMLGDERFKKIVSDIGLKDKLNILVNCGQNQRLVRYIQELYKPWIRVISDEDTPIALGLCDMVAGRPQAEIIAQTILLEKLFFSIFALGAEEHHTQEYLGYDIIIPCKDAADLFNNIKKLLEDRSAFGERFHHIQAIKSADGAKGLKDILLAVLSDKGVSEIEDEIQ